MVVMKGLKAIYIRGGYWEHSKELRLSNFGIDVATEDYNNQYAQPEDRAVTVEQCHCPPNYQGLCKLLPNNKLFVFAAILYA